MLALTDLSKSNTKENKKPYMKIDFKITSYSYSFLASNFYEHLDIPLFFPSIILLERMHFVRSSSFNPDKMLKTSGVVKCVESNVSTLYLACLTNDHELVKKILTNFNSSFSTVNDIEPNGSTALHVAAELGHTDIIKLLLNEFGVLQHRKNHDGLIAYQVAKDEDVRRLFCRPSHEQLTRFSENILEQDVIKPGENINKGEFARLDDNLGNPYISAYRTPTAIITCQYCTTISHSFSQPSRLLLGCIAIARVLARLKGMAPPSYPRTNPASVYDEFRTMIDRFVTPEHHQYAKALHFVDAYYRQNKIEYLFRLYTMSTPFYKKLHDTSNTYYFEILKHLQSLQDRYFQGVTYRGMVLDKRLFHAYIQASHHSACLLVTHSFMSTTTDPQVATMFSYNPLDDGKISVLMIFNFSQPSDIAIQLYDSSASILPCWSEFPHEREVLVLPDGMFKIIKIEQNDNSQRRFTIWLDHEPIVRRSYWQVLKLYCREGYNNIRKKFQH